MFLGYENLAKGSLEATIIRIGRTPSLYKGQETNPEKNFDAFKHVISNAILLKKKSEDNYLFHDIDLKQSVSFKSRSEFLNDASDYYELISKNMIGTHYTSVAFNAFLHGIFSDPYSGQSYKKIVDAVGGKFYSAKSDKLSGECHGALYCLTQTVSGEISFDDSEIYINGQPIFMYHCDRLPSLSYFTSDVSQYDDIINIAQLILES